MCGSVSRHVFFGSGNCHLLRDAGSHSGYPCPELVFDNIGSQEYTAGVRFKAYAFSAVLLVVARRNDLVRSNGNRYGIYGIRNMGSCRTVSRKSVVGDRRIVADSPLETKACFFMGETEGASFIWMEAFGFRQRFHLIQRDPVMDDLRYIVKQHCADQRLTGFALLLSQHCVEAADGVALQAGHGAAAIQDKYQFRQILLHNKTSYNVFGDPTKANGLCGERRSQGTVGISRLREI